MAEVPDDDLAALAADAERMVRAAEAYRCEVVGEIERRGLHARAGHRDIAEYARACIAWHHANHATPNDSPD